MAPDFLALFRCPQTGQPLREAGSNDLECWNRALAAAGPRTLPDGAVLRPPFAAGLLTSDGELFYPVVDGIPVLTPDGGFRQARN